MTTGLAVFDSSVQDTNLWLKQIEETLAPCRRHDAYAALRATLHALRDALPAQVAVNFAAQLPMVLRGLYYEGWTLPERPARIKEFADFEALVDRILAPGYPFETRAAIGAAFAAIATFISAGEVDKLLTQVPPPVREVWPALAET